MCFWDFGIFLVLSSIFDLVQNAVRGTEIVLSDYSACQVGLPCMKRNCHGTVIYSCTVVSINSLISQIRIIDNRGINKILKTLDGMEVSSSFPRVSECDGLRLWFRKKHSIIL